jgi:hypothetical protein
MALREDAMQRWPWITMIAAAVFALSPLGQDVVHGTFFSGEQLTRSLSQLLLELMAAIVAALALIEWVVRTMVARRQAKRIATAVSNTES